MYSRLGIHWASSIPAFLAVACLPFPFLFYKYGAAIRQKCKYAAEADAFMQRIRGQAQQQPQDGDASNSSRTASVEAEELAEQEAADYSYKQENEPQGRFQEMKTGREAEDDGLKKVHTGRSNRSRRTVGKEGYYDNPYEIDRVHTKESFRPTRSRAESAASGKLRPVLSKTRSRQ
jgi:hypothetical protein